MKSFSSYPLFIQGTLVVIVLLLISLLLTYVTILIVRYRSSVQAKLRQSYQAKFREILISDVIANPDFKVAELSEVASKLESLHLGKKRVKRILIEDIKHFRAQFAGETHDVFRSLYLALNLHDYSVAGLKSGDVDRVILSIKELMVMEVVVPQFDTVKFLNHKNLYVRQITRQYVIAIEEGGVEKVLNTIKQPISGIERLELFQAVTGLELQNMPDFSRWIGLDHTPTLISLCLKLAVHFQQFTSASRIEQLLTTEDKVLKNEVINALGKLLQPKSENALVSLYDEEEEEVKIEIIKAIGRISSGNHLNFLKNIFDNESPIVLKKHAARSLVSHDSLGSIFLTTMYKRGSTEDQLLLNHVLNSNIKY